MMKILRFALCLIIISTVQSSVVYRKFRELDIPSDESQPAAVIKEELIQNLNKESSVPVALKVVEPVAADLVQDETKTSVQNSESEKLKLVNAAQESAAIAANEIIPQQEIISNKDEQKEIIQKVDNIVESKPEKEESLDKKEPELKPEEEKSVNQNVEKNEELLIADETKKGETPQKSDDKNNNELRQNEPTQAPTTTSRPSIFQAAQQIISNNPLGQFIDSFRRPLASTASPVDASQVVVTVPNLLQQFQAGVQNFTSQITNAFNPNAVQQQGVVSDTVSTVRPNIIQTLQTNFQNAVSSVFRPLNITGTVQPPANPLQVVFNPLQAVQNFLSGNRGDAATNSASAAVSSSVKPEKESSNNPPATIATNSVDDKVDHNLKNSQEVSETVEQEQAHDDNENMSYEMHEEHEEHGESSENYNSMSYNESHEESVESAHEQQEQDTQVQQVQQEQGAQVLQEVQQIQPQNLEVSQQNSGIIGENQVIQELSRPPLPPQILNQKPLESTSWVYAFNNLQRQ